MSKRIAILVILCLIVISVIVFLGFFPPKTPVQQISTDTTVIDGFTYSTKSTPYGIFTVRFFVLRPDGSMEAHAMICSLLYPNEPTPPNVVADPPGTPQFLGLPGLLEDVMIDGWLYSQRSTSFTKFTCPPSTILLWTEMPNEPLPAHAQAQQND